VVGCRLRGYVVEIRSRSTALVDADKLPVDCAGAIDPEWVISSFLAFVPDEWCGVRRRPLLQRREEAARYGWLPRRVISQPSARGICGRKCGFAAGAGAGCAWLAAFGADFGRGATEGVATSESKSDLIRAEPELPIRPQNDSDGNQQEHECEQQPAGFAGSHKLVSW